MVSSDSEVDDRLRLGRAGRIDEAVCSELRVNADELAALEAVLTDCVEEAGLGIQAALSVRGRMVFQFAGGYDLFEQRSVDHDSVFCVMSASKGAAAIALLYLRAQGFYQPSDLVADYWPEFGRGGKRRATIEHLLSHRLGMPELRIHHNRWGDHDYMRTVIEKAEVVWPPGSKCRYEGGLWGHIVEELCRRWTSRTLGEILHEVCVLAGVSDCYMGLPSSRVDRLVRLRESNDLQRGRNPVSKDIPPFGLEHFNDVRLLAASLPSSGLVTNARSLAHLYDLIAAEGDCRSGRVWRKHHQKDATVARNDPRKEGPVGGLREARFGLGFLVPPTPQVFGSRPPSGSTVGHAGATGAVAFGDPVSGVSFAMTTNEVNGPNAVRRCELVGNLVQKACSLCLDSSFHLQGESTATV